MNRLNKRSERQVIPKICKAEHPVVQSIDRFKDVMNLTKRRQPYLGYMYTWAICTLKCTFRSNSPSTWSKSHT